MVCLGSVGRPDRGSMLLQREILVRCSWSRHFSRFRETEIGIGKALRVFLGPCMSDGFASTFCSSFESNRTTRPAARERFRSVVKTSGLLLNRVIYLVWSLIIFGKKILVSNRLHSPFCLNLETHYTIQPEVCSDVAQW